MSGARPAVRRTVLLTAVLALAGASGAAAPPSLSSHAGAEPPPATAVADPAALVHPLDGTGTGPVNPGTVGEFPGADTPFGMIQWSPDTSPDAVQSGGGYAYADTRINGFSLTHLSGTGCPSYQDVPILPTEGAIGSSPEDTVATFSHAHERATPGRYQVTLGPGPIDATLAVTTRTGIARFAFPSGTGSNVLFKVADSANPVSTASVHTVGDDEVEGQDTSGGFCQTGTNYTMYFFARFDRPFSSAGTWTSVRRRRQQNQVHGHVVRRVRDLRHRVTARRPHEGRHLLRQRPRRRAEPRRRGSGLVTGPGGRPGPRAVERPARSHRRAGARRPRSTPSTPRCTTRFSSPTSCPT